MSTLRQAISGLRHRKAQPRWRAALAVALAGFVCWLQPAAAQRSDGPNITVPPTIIAEPASQTVLTIQVGPPERLPANSFVRLRGLPASVSLSEGHAISPGLWAVPIVGLSTLKAIVPAGVTGRTEVTIHLVSVDGATLAETKTALVVGTANSIAPGERERSLAPPQRAGSAMVTAPPARPEAKPDRVAPTQVPLLSGEEKGRAERLVASGDRHLEQGNIGAARMFFQRAAEAGLALGALKVAATYDPVELQRLGVKVQGATIADRNEARKWYERARTLGAPEAEDRLARLGGS